MSVSSPLRLSGSVLVTGRRRTGWPETSWTRWVTKAERTQDGLQNQGLRSHTADERTLGSTQGLNAGPPRQDLHPEPALLLCRDLWWCGRPPMVPQQLSPSSFSYIWRYLTCTPTCLIRASYTYEQNLKKKTKKKLFNVQKVNQQGVFTCLYDIFMLDFYLLPGPLITTVRNTNRKTYFTCEKIKVLKCRSHAGRQCS